MTSRVCATTSRGRRLKDPATVATINQPDELGANALTLAASLNVPKPEIIKALLKAGADVNAKLGEEWSEKDTSALYRAVEGESLCGINQCVGCTSPFSATTRPCWLHRVVRDPHRHAVELASRRWREDHDSAVAETRRDNLINALRSALNSMAWRHARVAALLAPAAPC